MRWNLLLPDTSELIGFNGGGNDECFGLNTESVTVKDGLGSDDAENTDAVTDLGRGFDAKIFTGKPATANSGGRTSDIIFLFTFGGCGTIFFACEWLIIVFSLAGCMKQSIEDFTSFCSVEDI